MERVAPVVLTIGTTHPLNIAGVGLVARSARSLQIRVVTIVAGISAQNAGAVLCRTPVDEATIGAQFAALRDVPVGAIHIGALLSARSVLAVVAGLRQFAGLPVVCDPVIAATGGDRLADDPTIFALRDTLFKRCLLVTPNLAEASLLLDGGEITTVTAMELGAQQFRKFGAPAVLLKGGHLAGAPTDVLATAAGVTRFSGERIALTLRGTGDLLASAIAARLAYGDGVVESVETARAFVRDCILAGMPFAGTRTFP